ncbi:kelch-like protein 12 [Xenia sp. Carnegie-2017]|uniref:kelch-like protein 12 n=1 Tax=Xenia sp. Carnegie-2017 TaxID=2897299 RepID=UPI001F04E268|nr:kelch-like protein 12 [Xenia sp. Carnegie-2017]
MEQMKATMFQMLEKLNINEQHVQTLTSSIEIVMNSVKCDILIAGGYQNRSVEIFSWKEEKWFNIASMENEHKYASSFIYNDNLFVFGGNECKSIETLNLNKFPLAWKTFPAMLPYQTVVYKQQIFHIGGYDYDKHTTLDQISEIKIRVLQFDPRTFTFKELPPLPHPLCGMATVRWRDQVVLLGGYDHSKISNSVIMYDTKTCKITVLPSMLEKRFKCCAVITGDTIVVMGGLNDNREYLKTVECFRMGSSYSWIYLPSMNEPRYAAIAEVLPSGEKYL